MLLRSCKPAINFQALALLPGLDVGSDGWDILMGDTHAATKLGKSYEEQGAR